MPRNRRRRATLEDPEKSRDTTQRTQKTGGTGSHRLQSPPMATPRVRLDSEQEQEIERTFMGKFDNRKSIDPAHLLAALDDQEGLNERMANRPSFQHTLNESLLVGTRKVENMKRTPEERFDNFVARTCERKTQYFAIMNMLYIAYALFVFSKCTFFFGAHQRAFITVEEFEPRLNRLIWITRGTCMMLVLTAFTLKAYLRPSYRRMSIVGSGVSMEKALQQRQQAIKAEWETGEGTKFFYVVMQMTVFLMATVTFLYGHCTQLIITLPREDTHSLYGMLHKNIKVDYIYEWDAGPKPSAKYPSNQPYYYRQDIPTGKEQRDFMEEPHDQNPGIKAITAPGDKAVDYGMSGYIDTAQYELKCCGLEDWEDWTLSKWYDRRATKMLQEQNLWIDFVPQNVSTAKSTVRSLPLTCCKQLNQQNGMGKPQDFLNMITLPCQRKDMFNVMDEAYINLQYNCTPYPTGCFELIKNVYDPYSFELMIHGAVMMIVSMLLILLSQLFVTSPSNALFQEPELKMEGSHRERGGGMMATSTGRRRMTPLLTTHTFDNTQHRSTRTSL
ncbi:uncharacterized protein LOC142338385 isoform X2 [Convolutriloba macropyga]|uniref:uncharacterized protein LOC142338385 isoform X2 n=1 Tax=Convolutriloba macropyga TaxID=536237 RepID=UPI003F5273DC